MKFWKGLLLVLGNKYLLALSVFLVWVLFFDTRDVVSQLEKRAELNSLLETRAFYEREIAVAKKQLSDIQNDAAALEKIAREKYKMKKSNEDLFLVE